MSTLLNALPPPFTLGTPPQEHLMSNASVHSTNLPEGPAWQGPTLFESVRSAARRWVKNRQRPASPPADRATQAAREAQALRAYASTFDKTDRGFAADLYAAANRHEGLVSR
jgi:hypothetical protein